MTCVAGVRAGAFDLLLAASLAAIQMNTLVKASNIYIYRGTPTH